jgi:lipopolysaccharide export system protein LptC
MALTEDSYSRLIVWLKIGLPLIALGILSTLFFLARAPNIERAIPYAEVDLEALAREPRITEPDFSGVTPDGVAISLKARSAQPDPDDPSRFLANGMEGEVEATDGSRLRMSSVGGVVDTGAGTALLSGDVLVETSTGYAVRTEELVARLNSTRTESTGPVDVMAPFGHMTAGRLIVTRDAENSETHLLVFTDGVDLIYDPEN